jgi:hypothetical protein
MDETTFLAQIWGPVILAAGIGMFASRNYYLKVYRELEKAPFAVVFFGMFAMATGLMHVNMHNFWETLPQFLVSLLGWGLLIKGAICTAMPKIADRGGDWWANTKLMPLAGFVMLILGSYLSWFAYLA